MTDTAVPLPPAAAPQGEDNTVAILAYVTPILCGIGIVIAILMHQSKKTKLGAYHLRQALGLLVVGIAVSVALFAVSIVLGFVPFLGTLLRLLINLVSLGLSLGGLYLMIMGILAAVNREQKPLPVLGPYIEKYLGTAFD